MELEKKNLILYKTTIKHMLTSISKFGTGDGCDIYLYHFINKISKFVYPVMILNQNKNPWDETFYPSNLFIIGIDNPKIDYYNTDKNKDYFVSSSSLINFSEFRKKIKESFLKIEFDLVDNIYHLKNMPILNTTIDKSVGYVDKFKNFKSIEKLINLDDKEFVELNEECVKNIHSELIEKTNTTIKIKDEIIKFTNKDFSKIIINENDDLFLKLFYSIIPILPNKIKYSRIFNIKDEDITSTVFLKLFVNSIIINNFYKYIDIENKIKEISCTNL